MKYKITYLKENKQTSKIIEVNNIEELKESSLLPKNILDIKEKEDFFSFINIEKKVDLLPIFRQLNIMLNANLTISEALQLVQQDQKDKKTIQILTIIQNCIKNSTSIEKSFKKYKINISKSIIIFLELGIQNGNIKKSVNSIVDILTKDQQSLKSLKNSLRYPIILFGSLLVSLVMICVYVVPNFEYIFLSLKDKLPLSTIALLNFKYIVVNYWYIIISFLIGIIYFFKLLYKKYQLYFDELILKIPIISEVIKSYLFYKLFLSLYLMVDSKYQFQIALKNSKDLILNLYIKKQLNSILHKLKQGSSISKAFEETKLFDNLIIKLLFTAQTTSNYGDILKDIIGVYDQQFTRSIKNFTSTIEPIVIFIIAIIVLWLILALMSPVWDMGSYGI